MSWFILFATAMGVWIAVAVRQNMDLVRPDYYEAEIRYQRQLDRLNRAEALGSGAEVRVDMAARALILTLPPATVTPDAAARGEIHLYRPSDASLDLRLPLAVDASGRQRIGTEGLRPGLWKVRVSWGRAGEDYFIDKPVVLPGGAQSGSLGEDEG